MKRKSALVSREVMSFTYQPPSPLTVGNDGPSAGPPSTSFLSSPSHIPFIARRSFLHFSTIVLQLNIVQPNKNGPLAQLVRAWC